VRIPLGNRTRVCETTLISLSHPARGTEAPRTFSALAKSCPGPQTGAWGPPLPRRPRSASPHPPWPVRPVAPGLRAEPRSAAICDPIYSNFLGSLRSSGFIRKYAQEYKKDVRGLSRGPCGAGRMRLARKRDVRGSPDQGNVTESPSVCGGISLPYGRSLGRWPKGHLSCAGGARRGKKSGREARTE
jgi:hypothetical protein